jgi:hypothetical protein
LDGEDGWFRSCPFLKKATGHGSAKLAGARLEARGKKSSYLWPFAFGLSPSSGSTRAIGIPRFDEAGILRPRLTEANRFAGHNHHLLSTPLTSFAFGVLRQVRTLGGQSPRTPVHCSHPAECRGRSPAIQRDAFNTKTTWPAPGSCPGKRLVWSRPEACPAHPSRSRSAVEKLGRCA